MSNNYNFDTELKISEMEKTQEKIKQILTKHFKAEMVLKNPVKNQDDKGIDYYVYLPDYDVCTVDVKIRKRKNRDNDVALETWSNIERQKIGWTRDKNKKTDFIMWLWQGGEYLILPFTPLREVFEHYWQEWKEKFNWATQRTNNLYNSECVFIPILYLKEEIEWHTLFNS